MMATRKSGLLAFGCLALIWGSNFIFMKWASAVISPAQVAALRVIFGFLPVLAYALATRALSWSHIRYAHHFFVMSLLAASVYYVAYAKGTALLPSSVAGVLSGAIPLFTSICAWVFLREEQMSVTRAVGVALGFAGVLLIARPWSSAASGVSAAGVLYIVIGSFSVGCSFVYARRFLSPLKLPAVALTTYQLGLGAVLLSLLTGFNGVGALIDSPRAGIGLILGLGLLGTGVAYIAYYHIVEQLGALAASSVTYLAPVVALVIAICLVGEVVTSIAYVAVGLILAGVAVMQFGSSKQEQRTRTPHNGKRLAPTVVGGD